MSAKTIEERLTALEAQVAKLMAAHEVAAKQAVPWWEKITGTFKDDPEYDEAMRLGAEYRRSQPTAAEETEATEAAGGFVPQPDGKDSQT